MRAAAAVLLTLVCTSARGQWLTFPAPWTIFLQAYDRDVHGFAAVYQPGTKQRLLFAAGATATAYGLYRSDDDGRTWSRLKLTLEDGSAAVDRPPVVVWAGTLPPSSGSPFDADELYVSIAGPPADLPFGNNQCDLLRSRDLGQTWTAVIRKTSVCTLTIDSSSNVMYGLEMGYSASFFATIHRSRDRGVSWQATNYPRFVPSTLRIGDDGTLYSVAGFIYASKDQGDSWTRLGEDGDSSGPGARPIARDIASWHEPLQGTTVSVAATSDGLYKSIDGGRTWGAVGLQGFEVRSLSPIGDTASAQVSLLVGYSQAALGKGHAGVALLQGDVVQPLSNGLPTIDGIYFVKAGGYALSDGALSVCKDVASCIGGLLPAIGNLVEFHNALLDHYFMTLEGPEANGVDRGDAGPGWSRTGQILRVYTNLQDTPRQTTPVCRFYGTPGTGPNSHFFTADPAECGLVSADPGWMLETGTAFAATRPERQCQAVDGRLDCGQACAKGKLVYRLYNGGFPQRDSNHRYIADVALYRAMQAQGWIGEDARLCTAQ